MKDNRFGMPPGEFEKYFHDWSSRGYNRRSKILISDETLRDGEQQIGVYIPPQEKLKISQMLDELGVGYIDAGLPTSDEDVKAIRAVAKQGLRAEVFCTGRTVKADIERANQTEAAAMACFVASSALRLERDLKKKPEDLVDDVYQAIKYIKQSGMKCYFVTEDTLRAKPEHIKLLYETAEQAGVDMHIVCDSVGSALPIGVKNILDFIRREVKITKPLSFHGHNDIGLATINTITAIENGCDVPSVTILGYGERAGNAPLEEVALNLELMGHDTGLRLEKIQDVARYVAKVYRLEIPVNKPILGRNAHAHDSGIHAAALRKCGPISYSPYDPSIIGREVEIALGKGAGVNNILFHRPKLESRPDILQKVTAEVKRRSIEKGKAGKETLLSLEELDEIIGELI